MNSKADLIIKNGEIYSVTSAGKLEISEAFAVKDGQFIFVGDNAEADAYKGDSTRVIEDAIVFQSFLEGLLTAADIDAVCADRPVVIRAFDKQGLEKLL